MDTRKSSAANDSGARLNGVKQAARVIGIHPATLCRWIAAGDFIAADVVIRGRKYWRLETLQKLSGVIGAAPSTRDDAA